MKRKRYTPEFKSQIVLEDLKEEKTINEIASDHGIHVNQIWQWRNALLEQMPMIFAKKNLESRSRAERFQMIDWDNDKLPMTTQAELLGLNRSRLYYKPVEPSPEEVFIKHKINEV